MRHTASSFGAALLAAALAPAAFGQSAPPAPGDGTPAGPADVEHLTVTATRIPQRDFDVPASVDTLALHPLGDQAPGVNLSEATGRVPGLVVRNRQNYAQDLQVSSRGFGARAAFGVRGVRLVQDGIPFTMPDGQGQTALFDLDSAARIEVLRGPFAALYGNSAGGVLSLFTAPPPDGPTLGLAAGAGSFGARKASVGFGTTTGDVGLAGQFSRFETDGFREHSAARRDLAGVKATWGGEGASRLSLTATTLDQPGTQDPLGLTRAQLEEDPHQAGAGALAFDTRKDIAHRQVGLAWNYGPGTGDTLQLHAYGGKRRVTQFLAFSGAAASSSGGVVDLDRGFGGIGAQWTRQGHLAGGRFSVSLGVDYDRMNERRKGFVNEAGQAGALRRDELDAVWNLDQYAIAEWWFAEHWRVAGGVRHSRVTFDVRDDFINAFNPDDSGRRAYAATRPVIGLLYRLTDAVNLYASAGRGFETPTATELAYRPDGQSGMNFALEASTSENLEVGAKAQWGTGNRLNLSVFRTTTRNDIVPDANVGGRATFRNAARTVRQGLELGLESRFDNGLSAQLAYTALTAEFRDYAGVSGEDLSGNALPGVPRSVLYGELAWRHAPSGFVTALEAQRAAKVWVDDANTDSADAHSVVNWRFGFDWRPSGWRISPYVRIDNLLDRRYVGSIIVNAANGRYYEPAPGRAWFAGVKAAYAF